MTNLLNPEQQAARAIQDARFEVHDANLVFRANCPNIDLIVYGKTCAHYVQVKSSKSPASKDHITINGSPWTEDQLYRGGPIYNKHSGFLASFIVIVDVAPQEPAYYVAPPEKLFELVLPRAVEFAARPKRDGSARSVGFRKELPKGLLRRG
jgi:hypothetical protein